MAARARHRPLFVRWNRKLQQFGESRRCDPMHGRAHHHFDSFQVQAPRPAPSGDERVQPPIYFAGELFMNRNSRFFSCGVQALPSGSTGRCPQIFSLTAISSAFSS